MKKAIIVLSSLLIITILLFVFKKFNSSVKIVTFKHNYLELLTSDDETLNVYISFSNKKSFFTEKDNITRITLAEKDDSKAFTIPLNNVYKTGNTYNYQDTKYYEFIFELDVLKVSEVLNINEAKIIITYNNDEIITLNIGEISLKKVNLKNSSVDLFSIKSVVNEINDLKTIVGFSLTFNIKEPIRITNISFLTNNILSDLNLSIKDLETSNSLNLRLLYGNDYSYFGQVKKSYLELTENTNYFIPIKYIEFAQYKKLPIIIEYEISGISHTFYFDDCIYFNDNEMTIEDTYEYNYK